MLSSRNPAAHAALLREGLRLCATPLDMLLGVAERRGDCAQEAPQHPLLLVVGAPRSGTTLVHQVAAHHLDVTYFPNSSSVFPRSSLLLSTRRSRAQRPGPASFRSYFGQTREWRAANDGFHVWDRWLGDDRYRPGLNFRPEDGESMRRFLRRWTRAADRPLLNKNNRNSVCLPLLARELPEARFLVVRRDPLSVVQSLLGARESVQGHASIGWGLCSRDSAPEAGRAGQIDAVCDQILEIEARLDEDLVTLDGDRLREVSYEEFCARPDELLDEWCSWIPGLRRRAGVARPAPFTSNTQLRLTAEDTERVCSRLGIFQCARSSRAPYHGLPRQRPLASV